MIQLDQCSTFSPDIRKWCLVFR